MTHEYSVVVEPNRAVGLAIGHLLLFTHSFCIYYFNRMMEMAWSVMADNCRKTKSTRSPRWFESTLPGWALLREQRLSNAADTN